MGKKERRKAYLSTPRLPTAVPTTVLAQTQLCGASDGTGEPLLLISSSSIIKLIYLKNSFYIL